MKRKAFAISALAVSAALIAGAALAQQGLNIAIATGGTGGVYYPLGGGMANVLTKNVPGFAATARVTGGSVDNLKLIGSQQSEVALVMVDAALDALKGEDKFKGSPVDVRTLMVLYPNRMHVVSMEGTGVEKMSDLKGKRVSTGSPGSATEVIPAKTYPGQDKDNKIAVVQNILVTNASMPDKVAYDIVRTFIEKRDELVAVHGEAQSMTLDNQTPKNSPIPWHPGAVKYFTEKGIKM